MLQGQSASLRNGAAGQNAEDGGIVAQEILSQMAAVNKDVIRIILTIINY